MKSAVTKHTGWPNSLSKHVPPLKHYGMDRWLVAVVQQPMMRNPNHRSNHAESLRIDRHLRQSVSHFVPRCFPDLFQHVISDRSTQKLESLRRNFFQFLHFRILPYSNVDLYFDRASPEFYPIRISGLWSLTAATFRELPRNQYCPRKYNRSQCERISVKKKIFTFSNFSSISGDCHCSGRINRLSRILDFKSLELSSLVIFGRLRKCVEDAILFNKKQSVTDLECIYISLPMHFCQDDSPILIPFLVKPIGSSYRWMNHREWCVLRVKTWEGRGGVGFENE